MYNLTQQQLDELANASPEAKQVLKSYFPDAFKTAENVMDLKDLRTAGLHALSVPYGGLGRVIVVSLNNSPYHDYTNKSLLVGQSFKAEVVQSGNDQLIIFKTK